MMRLALWLGVGMLWVAAASGAQAEEDDRSWSTLTDGDLAGTASVHGQVIYGDTLNLRIVGEKCDQGVLYFTVYSVQQNVPFTSLSGQTLQVNLNKKAYDAKVLAARPFVAGHSAFMHLPPMPLAELQKELSAVKNTSIKIVSHTEFFDVTENTWSMKGFAAAVEQSKKICQADIAKKASLNQTCMPEDIFGFLDAGLRSKVNSVYRSQIRSCAATDHDWAVHLTLSTILATEHLSEAAQEAGISQQETADLLRNILAELAGSGVGAAQYFLATLYHLPSSDPRFGYFPQDSQMYVRWLRKSAAQKMPLALYEYAKLLLPSDQALLPPSFDDAYGLMVVVSRRFDDPEKRKKMLGEQFDKVLAELEAKIGEKKVRYYQSIGWAMALRQLEDDAKANP